MTSVAAAGDPPADGDPTEATSTARGGAAGVLVVGYGNVLRGDDGLGPRIVELLAQDPRFARATLVPAHQLAPELALDMSAASLVIFVDARTGDVPGAVSARHVDPAGAGGSASSHHLEPADLVALALELYGAAPAAFAVSVGAAALDVGDRLSPAVERALPDAVEAIARIVAGHDDA